MHQEIRTYGYHNQPEIMLYGIPFHSVLTAIYAYFVHRLTFHSTFMSTLLSYPYLPGTSKDVNLIKKFDPNSGELGNYFQCSVLKRPHKLKPVIRHVFASSDPLI